MASKSVGCSREAQSHIRTVSNQAWLNPTILLHHTPAISRISIHHLLFLTLENIRLNPLSSLTIAGRSLSVFRVAGGGGGSEFFRKSASESVRSSVSSRAERTCSGLPLALETFRGVSAVALALAFRGICPLPRPPLMLLVLVVAGWDLDDDGGEVGVGLVSRDEEEEEGGSVRKGVLLFTFDVLREAPFEKGTVGGGAACLEISGLLEPLRRKRGSEERLFFRSGCLLVACLGSSTGGGGGLALRRKSARLSSFGWALRFGRSS